MLPPAIAVIAVTAVSSCASAPSPGLDLRGIVELEESKQPEARVQVTEPDADNRYATRPPECGELALPEYPPEQLKVANPVIRVRVDFLLNTEGVTEELELAFVDEAEHPSAFLEAAEAAVRQWRCRPAWRHPRPEEPQRWVPLPYRSSAVFRFEAERADRAVLERRQSAQAANLPSAVNRKPRPRS